MSIDGLSRHERTFFEIAKSISTLSDHRCKLGCIIVDKHKIVSSGHNSITKCHRVQADIDKKYFSLEDCRGPIHAEVDALIPLIKRNYDLSNATLYVYRQDNNGDLAMSRPCERCMSLIKQRGIKRIKYTTKDGFVSEKLVYWINNIGE